MLASVELLSRLGPQFVLKSRFPKGFDEGKLAFCGMEPARRRDSRAALFVFWPSSLEGASVAIVDGGLKGLVEGVGRDDFESSGGLDGLGVESVGENFDGTVPALALLAGLLRQTSAGAMRSGKPSWVGDSGIFSRNGVEFPLAVGGPQMPGERPS
jgi:hypothetical protein